jgi:hypothetical protein
VSRIQGKEKEEQMRALAAELGFNVDPVSAETQKSSSKKTDKKAE